ncbi:nuclear transport factor 2 family protein [Sphingobacterium sp. JB170]|uniref:nuclear transport factor 2 family protein n=1 Tax=Sphingobacterium sp. JB170 TaxID=1434842 RepID=UPI0015C59BF1|nr:nuclear transport factor 2 family protein [Sphingobacterium sp. JB170]
MRYKYVVLDDHSVRRKFIGHDEIKDYFECYFIDYKTQIRLVEIDIIDENITHIEVEFTGDFREGKIDGTFNFTFNDAEIKKTKTDLIRPACLKQNFDMFNLKLPKVKLARILFINWVDY